MGKGTFGQVVKCIMSAGEAREEVAVKVIKNRRNYYSQGLVELKIMLKVRVSAGLIVNNS